MRSIILEFKRFITPHIGKAAYQFISEVIKDWSVSKSMMVATTDNASDMVSAFYELNEKLRNVLCNDHCTLRVDNFHVCCVAHILNIAVKCMGL